jgi:CHASE2 domain-containing sensor protein
MKRRRKTEVKTEKATPQPAQSSPPGEAHEGTKGLLRDCLKGVFFIILVLVLTTLVEHTEVGEQLERMGYDTLQRHLATEDVPIEILDISDLAPAPFSLNGKTGIATPRESLQRLIDALDSIEPKPVAVAIDIDFSPDKNGYITPLDAEFFQHNLGLSIPVLLGIRRTNLLPPEAWLGSKDYEKLAASIVLPKVNLRKMPVSIQTSEKFKPGRTMSAALAETFQESRSGILELLQKAGLIELVSEKKFRQGGGIGEILVDYSPLDKLLKYQTIRTIDPQVVRDQYRVFSGKVVILGDATTDTATDLFNVPARPELGSLPGIYLHACSAYTLARAPLYELKWQGRVLIDLLFSVSILAIIVVLRLYYAKRTSRKVATHRLEGILTLAIIAGALIVGVWFVKVTRLMWDDFILVFAGLIFHPSIERRVETLIKTARGSFRTVALEEPDAEDRK